MTGRHVADDGREAFAGAAGPLPPVPDDAYPPNAVELDATLDDTSAALGTLAPRWAPFLTLAVRGYLYRILTALGAVLLVYSVTSAEVLAAWLGLAATILGTGTASGFTPTRRSGHG